MPFGVRPHPKLTSLGPSSRWREGRGDGWFAFTFDPDHVGSCRWEASIPSPSCGGGGRINVGTARLVHRTDNPRSCHARPPPLNLNAPALAPTPPGLSVRGLHPAPALRDFGLIALDMDSTLINIECVDEIADAAGRKAEVAAITEAAMRGEIADYKDSLRRRVALLAGVPVTALEAVYRDRLRLNPGAETLLRACQAAGLKTLLVSGGFTFFTDRIRDRLGFDFTRSNVLEVTDGKLSGRMVDQPWGDICDGAEKRRMLLQTCEHLGLAPREAIAIGDGANDLPMMGEAGLSVAYHAKPKVREQAMVAIDEGGLDRLLEVLRQ